MKLYQIESTVVIKARNVDSACNKLRNVSKLKCKIKKASEVKAISVKAHLDSKRKRKVDAHLMFREVKKQGDIIK